MLLLVKLQASATLLKVTLLNGCFSRFFNCAHGTKLRNAPNIMNELFKGKIFNGEVHSWRRGVVVITTAQLHSTKPELRFCPDPNPACGALEIRNGENLWQWSRLEMAKRLPSVTIPKKQFIIIIRPETYFVLKELHCKRASWHYFEMARYLKRKLTQLFLQ